MSTNTDIDSLNLPGELTANGKQQYFIYCLYVCNSQSSRDILLKQTLKHIRSTPSTSTNCMDLFITNQLYMHTVVAIKKNIVCLNEKSAPGDSAPAWLADRSV